MSLFMPEETSIEITLETKTVSYCDLSSAFQTQFEYKEEQVPWLREWGMNFYL